MPADLPDLRRQRGAALVIVVAFIVLLSILVVAFFSRIGDDLRGSRTYADSVNVRQLADSAIGVVMGQLREATTVPGGAWGSQPGMIRVYGTGKEADAQAYAFYKLYSSHDMIVSASEMAAFDPSEYDPSTSKNPVEVPLGAGGWREQPAFFTDINEPVKARKMARNRDGSAGEVEVARYPVFDPAVAAIHEPGVSDPSRFERKWRVEGSAIALPAKLRDKENAAPMPVRWIYMLRDGTLTAPVPLAGGARDGAGKKARWSVVGGGANGVPSRDNPIVGRIAFWADDDTSKVNINTAGGYIEPMWATDDIDPRIASRYAGSFWDTPRVQSEFERGTHKRGGEDEGLVDKPGLANCQPAQNEFQRYPGHPSTTSLGLVFNLLLREQMAKNGHAKANFINSEQLYTWLPRLSPGGSKNGTIRLDANFDRELHIKSPSEPDEQGRTFHLFASVDEMLYSSENGQRVLAETALELPPDTITPAILDQTRFFLTAHSRAPELNLHGRPRVTIWPVWQDQPGMPPEYSLNNATDQLIRFCSRVGGREFIFTRKDPYSPTADFNIERNRQLFSYLREITSAKKGRVPGFGGSFEEKYAGSPGGRDQILVEIFDYIRTVNLKDTTRFRSIEDGSESAAEARAEKEKYMYAPRGIVVPTRTEVDKKPVGGLGRFPTITEATLVFYHAGWVGRPRSGGDGHEVLIQDPARLGEYNVTDKLVRAFAVFETFNPMQGYAPTSPLNAQKERLIHELDLTRDFTITTAGMATPAPLGFEARAKNQIVLSSGSTWGGRNFGGTEGFFHTMRDKTARLTGGNMLAGEPWPACKYEFRTQAKSNGAGIIGARVPVEDHVFNFSGGPAELRIKFNDQLIQKIALDFPSGNKWPVPRGLTDRERVAAEKAGFPANSEPPENIAQLDMAIWRDLGGFASDADIAAANLKPRPAIRREWAYSFERRLAWMITSDGRTGEHSQSPWSTASGGDGLHYTDRWRNIVQPGDTIRSLILGTKNDTEAADPRILATRRDVGKDAFKPHPAYATAARRAQTLRRGDGAFYFSEPSLITGALIDLGTKLKYLPAKAPDLPAGFTALRADGKAADFDTGIGNYPDGAFGGKADEGGVPVRWFDQNERRWKFTEPYFSADAYDPPMDTFFSPNRQIPSAVMFGSLPSRGTGWETLAFSPQPAGENHPGHKTPRDHLLLDLFTMPVVEPYAISEPFSSTGKVNLNYQLAPFGYIQRTTALRAALQPVRVSAIPQGKIGGYKGDALGKNLPEADNFRYLVDRDQTLRAFEDYFAEYKTDRSKGFFKSASEICDRLLYPKGETHAGTVGYQDKSERNMRSGFWAASALTGDNVREKAYADLYPRLTTKSNTYTVHYRVQTLRQRAWNGKGSEDDHHATWDETLGTITGENRGMTTIERYLDPEDKLFTTAAKSDRLDIEKESLEDAYRFRIIYNKRFQPW